MELYIKFPLAICFTHGSGWRSLVGCSPRGREESDTTEWLHFQFSLSCIGEGNGSPLQCSCLENPRDRRAWWAAVYGVAQSRTRLKRLSSSSSSSKTLYNLIWSPHPDFNLALGTLPLSLEKEMATSSSILDWKVPWTEEPGGLQFMGSQSDTAERLSTLFFYRAGTVTLLQLKLLRKRLCWLPTNHWALNWQLHWHGHWQLSQ